VTERMPGDCVARGRTPADDWRVDLDAPGLGVIATFTSSKHDTSPHVVQTK